MPMNSFLFKLSPILLLPLLATACRSSLNPLEQPITLNQIIREDAPADRSEGVYYYYFDEKVFLQEQENLLLVCFNDDASLKEFVLSLTDVSSLQIWNSDKKVSEETYEGNFYNLVVLESSDGSKIPESVVREFIALPEVRYVSRLTGEKKHLASVSDEFIVKLKDGTGLSRLQAIVGEFGCKVVRQDEYDKGVYFVRRPKDSDYGTIRLSSIFYETGLFEFTSPGFFNFNSLASADTNYSNQWGLKNTGLSGQAGVDINIEPAWNITEGDSDIVVAVLDCGVELTHPDLAGNLITGYDACGPPHWRSNEVGYGLVNAYGAFQQAALLQQKKEHDIIPGIDFTINNNSSYFIDEIYLEMTGLVSGTSTTLISSDCGSVSAGKFIGYPVYWGENIYAAPGTAITDIQVEFYARATDCPGYLRVGVEIDNQIPTYYSNFTFGWGDTYYCSPANSTVPNGSRRRLYINILDPIP